MTHDEPRTRRWKLPIGLGLAGSAFAAIALLPAGASGNGAATTGHDHHGRASSGAGLGDELARVRAATARFHRLSEAIEAGYELGWVNGAGVRIVGGCVSHPSAGAMGYHYFNADLMADDAVHATSPEVLVYAPGDRGRLELVAVEWVVRSAQSNPPGVSQAPSLLGMDMHILVPPPGPAFYLMHAWIWTENPSGMFADWNPDVSCG